MVQQKKIDAVTRLGESIGQCGAVVFVDFRGLTVGEATRLRARCRAADVRYQVVKNRLAKRAFEQAGAPVPEEALRGPTAVAFGLKEPTGPARVLAEFAKDCEHVQIKGGLLGRQWLDGAAVKRLAKIPPREALLARMLGSLKSPMAKLVWVLRAPLVQLSVVLQALAKQKAQ